MATTDDTLRALLDRYLDKIRHWMEAEHRHRTGTVLAWRHLDFYRHAKTGKHLGGWREGASEVRNAIHHVRALRRALGIRPHVTMTHEVGDLWVDLDGEQARTVEVWPEQVQIRSVTYQRWYGTGTPRELTRSGWRRVLAARDT